MHFSANALVEYFKAVQEVFQSGRNTENGKIKEVLSINAFIIALRSIKLKGLTLEQEHIGNMTIKSRQGRRFQKI